MNFTVFQATSNSMQLFVFDTFKRVYYFRFLEAYEAEGVPIWGVTTQNEPMTGFDVRKT